MNLKQKKNESDRNFYNFSILAPYFNKQLSGSLYSYPYFPCYVPQPPPPPPPATRIVGAKIIFRIYKILRTIFRIYTARGCENFKFLGDLLYWGT